MATVATTRADQIEIAMGQSLEQHICCPNERWGQGLLSALGPMRLRKQVCGDVSKNSQCEPPKRPHYQSVGSLDLNDNDDDCN